MAPTKKSNSKSKSKTKLKSKGAATLSVKNQHKSLSPPPPPAPPSPLDHWSFLDEIEAPMWIDLNSEATGTLHDDNNDDGWFLITHQFHQCSSRQLISAFSHSGTNSVSGRQQPPGSPKLPSSVSKSRGKHYKSRVWVQSDCTFTTKHYPVKNISSKLSGVTLEDVKKVKPRVEIDLVTKCGLLPAGAGVDFENKITETAESSTSNMSTSFRTFSGATFSREGKKNSISTATSESTERNGKSLEVAKQISGQPSKLLTSLRTSLRKSCGTRTDINRVRKSVGTKSSSSKSSVGSSSHIGHDGNYTTARGILYNDKTPDSRNAIGIYQVPKNILNGPNLPKASPVFQNITSGSGKKIETAVEKSINRETSKAKVENRPVRPKVLLPHRTNVPDRLIASKTKGKVQVSEQRKRFPDAGKENALETMATSKKLLARRKVSEVMTQVQKAAKERIPVKKDVGKQVCVKKNISCRNGQETSAGMVQKLYLR